MRNTIRVSLEVAIFKSDLSAVKALLRSGVDPNDQRALRTSPLHIATCFGLIDIVNELLAHGAKVDVRDSWTRSTPLVCAAVEGHEQAAKALINAGADVMIKTKEGTTAADLAKEFGHFELAQQISTGQFVED